MGLYAHVKFTILFKGVVETREIKLFKPGNRLTKDQIELELRETIGEPSIEVVDLKTFPETFNFHASSD